MRIPDTWNGLLCSFAETGEDAVPVGTEDGGTRRKCTILKGEHTCSCHGACSICCPWSNRGAVGGGRLSLYRFAAECRIPVQHSGEFLPCNRTVWNERDSAFTAHQVVCLRPCDIRRCIVERSDVCKGGLLYGKGVSGFGSIRAPERSRQCAAREYGFGLYRVAGACQNRFLYRSILAAEVMERVCGASNRAAGIRYRKAWRHPKREPRSKKLFEYCTAMPEWGSVKLDTSPK